MNTNRDLTNITGYIYKITSPLGDVYIGQTISIKDRKYSYKKGDFKKQTHLQNNCQKYNWNPADTFEVIDECLCGKDKELLNNKEIYWISYYDSFTNGLNCTLGGKGQLGRAWTQEQKDKQSTLINGMYERNEIPIVIRSGHNLSEEHKDKIKTSSKEYFAINEHWNKGNILSEEVKEKISNSVKGEKNGFYGKTHTEEAKQKMKIVRSKQIITEETKKKISESLLKVDQSNYKKHTVSVLQYDMYNNFIEKFISIKEASDKTGCISNSITAVCKGKRKSTKNFIWRYNIQFYEIY